MNPRLIELSRSWQAKHAPKRKPTTHAHALIEQVAFWHGITADDILGPSRWHPIVVARFDAYAAVAVNCRVAGRKLSTPEIGRHFGRDHSTVHAGLAKRGLRKLLPRQITSSPASEQPSNA